ncbi:MAG: SDR family oxidoreductase [Pseudomonadota bacterium]|jgi:Predicted nucleoside-diphosphate-sugar epimerases|nr:MAG: NAD(P)-dependent oxidoreductase [Pseudomonadota bacterium]
MAILVTGASGQFGRAAAERLLAKVPPHELILTTRTPEKLVDLASRGAQVRRADFDDAASLPAAFEGADRMLLISTARVGTRVSQHRNAIEAAKRVGVRHIVYTSVLGAAAPDNPAIVKLDHRATEEILEASGVAWTFLRDSQYSEAVAMAMAPVDIMTGRHISNTGEGRVAFVSRDDCVDCAVAILTTPGHENRAYDLTGPELFTYRQVAELISELAQVPVEYVPVDDEGMFAHFDSLGVPRHASDDPAQGPIPWCSTDMVSFARAIREGFFDVKTDHVERITGHPPRTLREVLLAYRPTWPRPPARG